MKPFNRASSVLAMAAAVGWLLATPVSAAPRQGGGRPTSSHEPSGGGGGSAAPAPRGGGSSGGSGGGSQPSAPRAVPRDNGAGASTPAGSGSSPSSRPTSNRGANNGTVVGRATRPVNGGGGTTVVIPNGYYGGFYPWAYGGLGFGGYYAGYYGYYDPWLYDSYYDAPLYAPEERADSELRLKVKPRDAKVYVDGYFAGVVDDFDGVFQRLHLVPGRHHIEIRSDGYAPLEFDIDARRNRTTTYEGELKQD